MASWQSVCCRHLEKEVHLCWGGGTWLNEAVCLQSCNCVFSSSLCARLPFSWEAVCSPWSKSTTAKRVTPSILFQLWGEKQGQRYPGGPLRNADASLLLFLLLEALQRWGRLFVPWNFKDSQYKEEREKKNPWFCFLTQVKCIRLFV